MVTRPAVPSANSNAVPRTFAIVTGLPNRLRAAVAPNATIADGFTIMRSTSSQILHRSIS